MAKLLFLLITLTASIHTPSYGVPVSLSDTKELHRHSSVAGIEVAKQVQQKIGDAPIEENLKGSVRSIQNLSGLQGVGLGAGITLLVEVTMVGGVLLVLKLRRMHQKNNAEGEKTSRSAEAKVATSSTVVDLSRASDGKSKEQNTAVNSNQETEFRNKTKVRHASPDSVCIRLGDANTYRVRTGADEVRVHYLAGPGHGRASSPRKPIASIEYFYKPAR